ncbi:MAG: hypothetical protein HYX97_01095 [Chloroflexi bacterium]|nr:hypothetical protein [Chloroflexota bacterium]
MVKKLLKEIARLKQEAEKQGLMFQSLSEEELLRKVRGKSSHSPFISSWSWKNLTSAGSTTYLNVWAFNPDSFAWHTVFLSMFFGPPNFFDDIAQAWLHRDTRWPELSTGPFSIPAGAISPGQNFTFAAASVPSTTYHGLATLWRGSFFGKQFNFFDAVRFDVTIL